MNQSNETFDVQLLWQNFVQRPLLWIVPTVAIAALATGYALVREPKWVASQALVVRDEAAGSDFQPGRFSSIDAMKASQETVLELATSRAVIAAALQQVGPPAGKVASANWPTAEDIDAARDSVSVKAPRGAEFGRTEVFYLNVESNDRQRAIALASAICDHLEAQLAHLRDQKSQSLVAELEKSTELARGALSSATKKLAEMETNVGSDLAELRILNELASGESNLRASVTQIKNETVQAETLRQNNQQLLSLLTAAQADSNRLVATPSSLLESQPALRRLKDGLVDAQLRTSQALGVMSAEHPKVQAAIAEEQNIRTRLNGELEIAIRGVEAELNIQNARIAMLQKRLSDTEHRMSQLAGQRAIYGNLNSEVKQRAEVVANTEKDLADARANHAAAAAVSLISRIDGPQVGAHPAGPSKSKIVLAGLAGGLIVGIGLVILTATPIPNAAANNNAESQTVLPLGRRLAAGLAGLNLKESFGRFTRQNASHA